MRNQQIINRQTMGGGYNSWTIKQNPPRGFVPNFGGNLILQCLIRCHRFSHQRRGDYQNFYLVR